MRILDAGFWRTDCRRIEPAESRNKGTRQCSRTDEPAGSGHARQRTCEQRAAGSERVRRQRTCPVQMLARTIVALPCHEQQVEQQRT
jgi:hypothetical protein